MEKPLNIYEKISLVGQDVKNIEKNLQVGNVTYGYKAVGDQDVILAVKEAENKHKIVSIPIKQELVNSEVIKTIDKDNKEKLTFVDNIKMTLKIVNLENPAEFIEVESFGKGIDSGDKGFGKASTYARKYALLNAYKIATGADPDANKGDDLKTPQTPDEKKVEVQNYFNTNIQALQSILQHFNVGDITQLSDKQYTDIYNSYKQRKLI